MNFIGVDIGGTVTKAGIYTECGQEIHVASQYAQVLSEQPGFTERNMHELWDTVCSVIKKALFESQTGLSQRAAAVVDRAPGIAAGVVKST